MANFGLRQINVFTFSLQELNEITCFGQHVQAGLQEIASVFGFLSGQFVSSHLSERHNYLFRYTSTLQFIQEIFISLCYVFYFYPALRLLLSRINSLIYTESSTRKPGCYLHLLRFLGPPQHTRNCHNTMKLHLDLLSCYCRNSVI